MNGNSRADLLSKAYPCTIRQGEGRTSKASVLLCARVADVKSSEVLRLGGRTELHKATVTANRQVNMHMLGRQGSERIAGIVQQIRSRSLSRIIVSRWKVDADNVPHAQSGIIRRLSMHESVFVQAPMYHNSTPITSNFLPSSLSGSFPNVRQELEMPLSRLSSSHSP